MTRVQPQFHNDLKELNFYLPTTYEQVASNLFQIFLGKLDLPLIHRHQHLHQMFKLNQVKKDTSQYINIIRESWKEFVTQNTSHNLTSLISQSEVTQINDFFLHVLTDPQAFALKYVDELFKIYEKYLLSNKGQAIVVQRSELRSLIIRLIFSKVINQYVSKYHDLKSQIIGLLEKTEAKLITSDKPDKEIAIQDYLLIETQFFEKLCTISFSFSPQPQPRDYLLVYIEHFAAKAFDEIAKHQFGLAIDLFQQLLSLIENKEPILFEKITNNKLSYSEIYGIFINKGRESKDMKEICKAILAKSKEQHLDFKQTLKRLIEEDLYSQEGEKIIRGFIYNDHKQSVPISNLKNRMMDSRDSTAKLIEKEKPYYFQEYQQIYQRFPGILRAEYKGDRMEYDLGKLMIQYVFSLKEYNIIYKDSNNKKQRCTTLKELIERMNYYKQ